ncbi:unnamed protein product [Eretmochelys imbricata]
MVCQTREGQTFSEEAPHGETKAAESLQQQKKIQNDLLQDAQKEFVSWLKQCPSPKFQNMGQWAALKKKCWKAGQWEALGGSKREQALIPWRVPPILTSHYLFLVPAPMKGSVVWVATLSGS